MNQATNIYAHIVLLILVPSLPVHISMEILNISAWLHHTSHYLYTYRYCYHYCYCYRYRYCYCYCYCLVIYYGSTSSCHIALYLYPNIIIFAIRYITPTSTCHYVALFFTVFIYISTCNKMNYFDGLVNKYGGSAAISGGRVPDTHPPLSPIPPPVENLVASSLSSSPAAASSLVNVRMTSVGASPQDPPPVAIPIPPLVQKQASSSLEE